MAKRSTRWKKNNPGCPCCECIVYTDNFNRANGPLGDKWEVTHTASIEDNLAKITSGEIIFQELIVDPQKSFYVTFTLGGPDITNEPQNGDVYLFIVYDTNGDHYFEVKFTVVAPGDPNNFWKVEVRQGTTDPWTSDADELITGCGTKQEPFLAARQWTVSYDRQVLRVGGTTPDAGHYELWLCVGPAPTIEKIGFQHGGGSRPIYIDNVVLSDHYIHDPTCPFAGCLCGDHYSKCWSDSFTMVVTNPGGCIVQLPETQEITLRRVYNSQSVWVSEKVFACYGCTTATWFYVQFFFSCEWSPDGQGFRLYMCSGYSDTDQECELCSDQFTPPVYSEWTFITSEADCYPFYMKFEFEYLDVCGKAPDDCDPGYPKCDNLIAEITE